MNQVILIGNLTKDPELRYLNTSNGQKAKCRFTLAVNTGDKADFIPVVVWDRQAENCDKYLSKGRKVAVNGRIQTGSYTKQDGTKVYTTDVVAFNVEFLGQSEERTPARGFEGVHIQAEPKPERQDEYITRQQYEAEKETFPKGFVQMAEQEEIPF